MVYKGFSYVVWYYVSLVLYIANGKVFCTCHSSGSHHFQGVEAYIQNKAVLSIKKWFQNGDLGVSLIYHSTNNKQTNKHGVRSH